MFGRYTLPSDDLLDSVGPTITAQGSPDPVDTAYPLTNWDEIRPSKPVKFTTTDVVLLFDFGVAVNIAVFALIYHNLDAGLAVLLEWSSDNFSTTAGSQSITIPTNMDDGSTVSPWIEVTGSPTYRYWRLSIAQSGSPNSANIYIGRPYFGGALRDLTNDVRWGEVESETQELIPAQRTDLKVELFPDADLDSKRRSFSGEFYLRDEAPYQHIQEFQSLTRSAKGRKKAWLLIPDADVNDAWWVRFDEQFARTRDTINNNITPFRVTEVSRGLVWP